MEKKSSLQILATSAYILELMRKCPGSLDNMLAEHCCFEDVENLLNLLGFFLMMLLVFQRTQNQNDKSEFQGTLHLLSEHTLLLLFSLLLLVFLFYDACLWTSVLDTTEDHEQYPHPRSLKTNILRKYHKGGLLAQSTSCYAMSQKLGTMHLPTLSSLAYRFYNYAH